MVIAGPRKKTRRTEPQFQEMPPQKMAVVCTKGDPNLVAAGVFPALYGAVYSLKFALKKQGVTMKVQPPRARWPNAHLASKEEWIGTWGIPIPMDVLTLTPRVVEPKVMLEVWEYGTIAEILHLGPYDQELSAIERLHQFITEEGCEIVGPHEEEYLTRPNAKVPKTIIRYAVRKKAR
ncbi:MAG: GyrI-like domain-containing protein [Chloroflexi bacterium]|nr:GyrI-like domain-containing protein [Chloroflexota bacterium]